MDILQIECRADRGIYFPYEPSSSSNMINHSALIRENASTILEIGMTGITYLVVLNF